MFTEYIEKTPGICGGKACLKGHRIRVQDVVALSEVQGREPDEIADIYQVPLAQVHVALAYYFENMDEIREEMRRGEQIVERLKEQMQGRSA
jgi:uncharacterized protein (DUF433 family)